MYRLICFNEMANKYDITTLLTICLMMLLKFHGFSHKEIAVVFYYNGFHRYHLCILYVWKPKLLTKIKQYCNEKKILWYLMLVSYVLSQLFLNYNGNLKNPKLKKKT